jgi:signal transduction histidine kinase
MTGLDWSHAAVLAAGLVGGMTLALLLRRRATPTRSVQTTTQPAVDRRAELLAGLASGMAHELGQPLSAARVGIEGIHYLRQIGREPSPEHLSRTLARVGMSLLAMTQTIEHLRSLARQDGPVPLARIDLVALVEGLLADRDQWLRFHDTRIEWAKPTDPVFAIADPAGIRLIITNLLRNAVEAVESQAAGRRLVRLSVGTGPSISVHDSGPGLPPEVAEQIFDPFTSTKGPGRGIGLSLARASAQRMGGDLTIDSQPGAGSRFTLVLNDGVVGA